VDKVAVGQGFLRGLLLSRVSIIPPMLHTHLHLNVALTRTSGRSLKTSRKTILFQKKGEHWVEKCWDFQIHRVKTDTIDKGEVHPRTCHEGPEGEQRYSSTLSLT